MSPKESYKLVKLPPIRRLVLDAGRLGRKRHLVHGLVEVDVTHARDLIQEIEGQTGERISFTAFIIHCLTRAIIEHPHLHAYRDWRNRLVIFDDINITAMFEVEFGGERAPMPHVFVAANHKSLRDIHDELRSVQANPHTGEERRNLGFLLSLPGFLRRFLYWIVLRVPRLLRKYSASVMVSAVGMFGDGGGWAITMPNFTLNVTVGGISKKPGVVHEDIAIREYLDLTISVDHDVVDGAPATRFVKSFTELLESAEGLTDLAAGEENRASARAPVRQIESGPEDLS